MNSTQTTSGSASPEIQPQPTRRYVSRQRRTMREWAFIWRDEVRNCGRLSVPAALALRCAISWRNGALNSERINREFDGAHGVTRPTLKEAA